MVTQSGSRAPLVLTAISGNGSSRRFGTALAYDDEGLPSQHTLPTEQAVTQQYSRTHMAEEIRYRGNVLLDNAAGVRYRYSRPGRVSRVGTGLAGRRTVTSRGPAGNHRRGSLLPERVLTMRCLRRVEILLCAACSAVLLAGCSNAPEIIQQVWSPDRRYRAIVYTVHGGATVELNTCVSVVEAPWGTLPSDPNTFVAVHGNLASPQGPYFAPAITVRWIRAGELEITYDPAARPVKRITRVGNTRIRYVVAPQQGLPPEPTPEGVRPVD